MIFCKFMDKMVLNPIVPIKLIISNWKETGQGLINFWRWIMFLNYRHLNFRKGQKEVGLKFLIFIILLMNLVKEHRGRSRLQKEIA